MRKLMLPDKMTVHLYMLGAPVESKVVANLDSPFIITI